MTPASRRFIAAFLLAFHGLISTCGSSLHVVLEEEHARTESRASTDSDTHCPARSTDHDHCLICHFTDQGQVLTPFAALESPSLSNPSDPPCGPLHHSTSEQSTSHPRAPRKAAP